MSSQTVSAKETSLALVASCHPFSHNKQVPNVDSKRSVCSVLGTTAQGNFHELGGWMHSCLETSLPNPGLRHQLSMLGFSGESLDYF